LTEVPHGVLDVFCSRLHDEGVSVETTVEVVSTTQPLITPEAMESLAEAIGYSQAFDPVVMSQKASHDASRMPVTVPQGTCAWRAVDEKARRASDVMTIEFSSPFVNPFARNSFGLLARLSLAREAATWYWVPLGERNGQLAAGRPTLLGMR
jgi:hypothetical protein